MNFATPEVIIRDMLKPQIAVDGFLADMRRRRLSDRTVTTYARTLDEFAARPDVCELDVSKLTEAHLERYLATKSRLARGTVSGIETHLNMWLRYLVKRRKIVRNPMDTIVRTRRTAAEDLDVVSVSSAQVVRMFAVARPGAELNALAIAALLGPRRHAIAGLRDTDYNRETGEMRFYEKGDKVIWKPIPHELRTVLEASYARGEISASADFQADPPYLVPPEGYLQRPKARDDRVIWRLIKKVASRAGVDCHVHALRAAFATFYLEVRDGNDTGLQELMGHTDPKTTKRYVRRFDKKRAMEPVRDLSWGLAQLRDDVELSTALSTASIEQKAAPSVFVDGNADIDGVTQIAEKALSSSSVVGAGGFEPPFPVAPGNPQAKQPTSAGDADDDDLARAIAPLEQLLEDLRARVERRSKR